MDHGNQDPGSTPDPQCLPIFRLILGGRSESLVRLTRREKGGFVKGSQKGGFGECTLVPVVVGTCERPLVPVFVPVEHLNVPLFRFSFQGNIRQNHPFGNHPLVKPRNPDSPYYKEVTSFCSTVVYLALHPFWTRFWSISGLWSRGLPIAEAFRKSGVTWGVWCCLPHLPAGKS